jgi:hypothetical protein
VGLGDKLRALRALLAISAYDRRGPLIAGPSEAELDKRREEFGGQLSLPAATQTRWYMSDLEVAEIRTDIGELALAARLMRSARRDGIYAGVLSTRTDGLVGLPKRFRGDEKIVAALEVGHQAVRSTFDEMCPPDELSSLAADGLELGVGVAELVPVAGRDYPILVRLDPEFLYYVWHENQWYYRSIFGPLPITPGDGRWVLHTPGGRMSPWQHGIWRAIGRAFVRKEHAALHKDNWEGKLANPARVAVAPQGAGEAQKQSWFRKVMAWGVNTVFGLTPGYDVKLLESNGRGWESFNTTIEQQNTEITIAVAGQTVTTDGGAGFQNSDIHKSIRADLIKKTADGLAYTLNTQVLPPFVLARWGENALANPVVVEWDTTPPKDRASEANSLVAVANALKGLTESLAQHGRTFDVDALALRFGISTVEVTEQSTPALTLAPTDLAKVVRVDEARESQGLPPIGDDRGQLTLTELEQQTTQAPDETSAPPGLREAA